MINFFYTDEYLKHDTGQHPESIERIKTIKKLIFENYESHNFLNPPLANKEIIYNVHDKEYVDYIFDNLFRFFSSDQSHVRLLYCGIYGFRLRFLWDRIK